MNAHGDAFHEQTISFGPCEGPTVPNGASFFCLGAGLETIDPFRMGDLETCFSTAVLCGPCESHRDAQVIATALESMGVTA